MKCNRFRSAVTAAKDLASARSTDRVPAAVKGRGSALARHLGQGLADRPASWGNHGEYRLLAPGANNFFQVKSAAVAAME